jgi:hypothetical protein
MGRVCQPGFYSLEPDEQARASEFLQKADRAAGTAPSAGDNSERLNPKSSDKTNSNIGGKNGNSSL